MPPSAFAEERDLSFQPVVNATPRVLTPAQIAFYNEEGYIKPLRAYGPAEAQLNRKYID